MFQNLDTYKSLLYLCENDITLTSSLIDTITITFPEHISLIDNALKVWDIDSLRQTLHLVKGSLSYLSLQKEENLLNQLEKNLQTNERIKFEQLYPTLRTFMLSLPASLAEKHKQYCA